MAITTTKTETVADALDQANPNKLADALAKVQLGNLLTPVEETITQAAAATALLSQPALSIQSVRVTGVGTAALGGRIISDSAATPSATVVAAETDNQTLTFEGTVTGVIVKYVPGPATALDEAFTTPAS